MKLFKCFISGCMILVFIFQYAMAKQTLEIEPAIRKTDQAFQKMGKDQKVLLHIDLATIYAKNENWEDALTHIQSIYTVCPELKPLKIVIAVDKVISANMNDYIPYNIVQKLALFGIKNVYTKRDLVSYFEILKPLCQDKCKPANNNKE